MIKRGYHTGESNQNRKEVLEIIRELPNSTTREIATLMPHVPFGTLGSVLFHLKKRGMITAGNNKKVVMKNGVAKTFSTFKINENPTPLHPKHKLKKPTDAGYEQQIEDLTATIDALTQWKQDAIARFPDLAVAPLVVQARKLVAEEIRAGGDNLLAGEVLAGKKDSSLMMRVTLKALEMAE